MDDSLTYDGTLRSFFYEQMDAVQSRRDAYLSKEVEAYVVNFLAEYARRPEAAGRTSRPLATQFLQARRDGSQALREVGDRALYIAGIVPESLSRSPVGVGYVSAIGRSAYHEVSARSTALSIFEDLADTFESITELLGEVVDPTSVTRAEDLLGIYERWRKYGRDRDAQLLTDAGVLLDPGRADIVQ